MITVIFLIIAIPLNAEAQKGWKTHVVEDEFSFTYPATWDLTERENRFTSVDASLTYEKGDTSASIILESGPDLLSALEVEDDNSILSILERIMESAYEDSNKFESGVDKYIINNQTAPYTISTFSKKNIFGYEHDYVVMVIAIKMDQDLLLGQFISTEDDFDRLLKSAEKIFKSIRPVSSTIT